MNETICLNTPCSARREASLLQAWCLAVHGPSKHACQGQAPEAPYKVATLEVSDIENTRHQNKRPA